MKALSQRLLLPAVLLGMQACWFYAWLHLIEVALLQRVVIAPVAMLFAIAGLAVRSYLGTLPLRPVPRIACYWLLWILLAALAGKLLLFPEMAWTQPEWMIALPRAFFRLIFETRASELLLLLGSGVAWHLGGRAATTMPGHETLLSQFQFGLVLLLGAFLLAHGLELSAGRPLLLSIAFFSISLSGIAVTRNRRASERASPLAERQFTGSLLTLLIIVALLGLLAGIAITPDLVEVFLNAGRAVLRALEAALTFLLSLLPSSEMSPDAELEPPATGDDSELTEFYRTLPWPALLRRILYILWVVVVLGMFLFALWRLCSMVLDWLKRRSNMSGVQVESLDTGLLADLRALLLWLDRKSRQAIGYVARFIRSRLGAAAEPSWNSVYGGFARWAAKKHRQRDASQSVHEYQATLRNLLPSAAQDIAFVTDVYALARYGRREPDSSTVQEMQYAVQRIRKVRRRPESGIANTTTEGAE